MIVGRVIRALAATALVASQGAYSAVPAGATPGPSDAPQYWFDTWNVPGLWASGARGGGVIIAEIDTGVNGNIPQLASKLLPGKDYVVGGDGRVDRGVGKSAGHGTGMASIMVGDPATANITGLAPDARILPIALPLGQDQPAGSNDHLADAIIWAADHGAKIINMSLGGARDPNRDAEPCQSDDQAAVDYALSKGVILVAAGGNNAEGGSPVEDPGVCLGVLAIGAVDRSNQVWSRGSRHPYLAMTAPGVLVSFLSLTGGGLKGPGTSQATAITSAALALIWSKNPTLTGRQIVSMTLSSLDNATGVRDPGYGYGVINPARAIASGNPAAPNPIYDEVQPFLNRDAAAAATRLNTPPAASATPVPGVVKVGAEPTAWSIAVVQAVIVALVGLVGVVVLVIGTWIVRRRRQRMEARVRTNWNTYSARITEEESLGPGEGLWQEVTSAGVFDEEKRTLFGRRKV